MHIVGVETAAQLVHTAGLGQFLKEAKVLGAHQGRGQNVGVLKEALPRRQSATELMACRGVWANWGFDAHLHASGSRLSATTRERRAAVRILRKTAQLSKNNIAKGSK